MGTVCAVGDGGRRVEVSCESGERMEFALSPATAKFVLVGAVHGAELEMLALPQGA